MTRPGDVYCFVCTRWVAEEEMAEVLAVGVSGIRSKPAACTSCRARIRRYGKLELMHGQDRVIVSALPGRPARIAGSIRTGI